MGHGLKQSGGLFVNILTTYRVTGLEQATCQAALTSVQTLPPFADWLGLQFAKLKRVPLSLDRTLQNQCGLAVCHWARFSPIQD